MRTGTTLKASVLSITLVIALSGCLGKPIDPNAPNALPTGHGEHHEEPTPVAADLGPPDVTLDAHAGRPGADLTFHPRALQVTQGSVVQVRVENQGSTVHTFTIHDLDADTGPIEPGGSRTLVFRADTPGVLEIMCDTPGHYQAGMKASLEVAA